MTPLRSHKVISTFSSRKKLKATKPTNYPQRRITKHTRTSTVTSSTQEHPEINLNLMNILANSQFKKKKLIAKSNNDESDSDSSVDDHLIHPDNLDLTSMFFQKDEKEKPFNFDCNAGVELSDSDASDENFKGFSDQPSTSHQSESNKSLIKKLNEKSAVNFEQLGAFSKNLESAKQKLIDFKTTPIADKDVDIGNLLAMGEKKSTKKDRKDKKSKTKARDSSESDWEEVEESQSTGAKDIEITISQEVGGKKKKEMDVEALIRREINKVKRENQIYLHKTSIICLVAHGNYMNNILNDSKLMEEALKLLPSQTCYPKERTNLNYFDLITTNFKRIVAIENQCFHSVLKGYKLESSLQLQLLKKKAICKRDFILQFIVLLRAIGIHCRLVMALPVLPKKVPQSELCTVVLKKNPSKDDEKDDKKVKKRKSSGNTFTLPQMDGNDDSVPSGSKKAKLSKSLEGKTNRDDSKKNSQEKSKRSSNVK